MIRERTAEDADRVLTEWYERGYVHATDLDTKSTRLLRVERDLGVLALDGTGRLRVTRHDTGGRG